MANLVAPQMPEYSNLAEPFLKGFTAVAAVNQARLKSELSMQRMAQEMALSKQAMEQKLAFKDREYDLREQDATTRANNAVARIDIAERGVAVREEEQRYERLKAERELKDTQGLLREFNQIRFEKGTPEFKREAARIGDKYVFATENPLGKSVLQDAWKTHETAVKGKAKALNDKLHNFGLPYTALENEDAWIQFKDEKGKAKRFISIPQSNSQGVPILDAENKQLIKRVPLDESTFQGLKKEFRSVVDASSEPPSRQMDKEDDKQSLALTRAKTAIAKGAPRAQVEERLRTMGIDPEKLDE